MNNNKFGQYATDSQSAAKMLFHMPAPALAKQRGGWDYCCRQFFNMRKTDNFSRNLIRLIAEKGLDPVAVYKKARIDRKLFSKIRSNPDYLPGKKTICALAIGMELNLVETCALLADSGYCLSRKLLFDVLLAFFIQRGIYDIDVINDALLKYGQSIF